MMTVGQLVEQLQRFPPSLRVLVDGYENGYEDLEPSFVGMVMVVLNYQEPGWEGPHKNGTWVYDELEDEPRQRTLVVSISRSEITDDERRGIPR